MIQTENILRVEIAPVENSVFTGLNNHSKVLPELLDRGFFHIFSPLDFIEAIQRGGTYIFTGKKQAVYQPCKLRQTTCNGMTKRWSMIIGGLANPSVRNNS